MKTKVFRFASVTAAIFIGILLVLTFTLVGSKSHGPLEDFMNGTGSVVESVENYFIISSREKQRSKSLKWIAPCLKDIQPCINPDRILLGAFDNKTDESLESIVSLEDSLHTKFPLIHLYTAWGSNPEHRFPSTKAKAITSLGSIPVITWEPWLTAFTSDEWIDLKETAQRDKGGMKDIADGVYDKYLEKWAVDIKAFGKTIFIRFGHEMNDPYRYTWGPQNNKPEDFIAAWKHVVDYFKNAGVNNVVWIWSPHPAYGYFRYYYPGDDYVNWVGVGALNYGTVAPWSEWWTFDEIFGNHYDSLSVFNKPVMITEFGSLAVGGDRALWYEDALTDLPSRYPLVKSVLFFHFSNDNTTTYKELNWYIIDDAPVIKVASEEINRWKEQL